MIRIYGEMTRTIQLPDEKLIVSTMPEGRLEWFREKAQPALSRLDSLEGHFFRIDTPVFSATIDGPSSYESMGGELDPKRWLMTTVSSSFELSDFIAAIYSESLGRSSPKVESELRRELRKVTSTTCPSWRSANDHWEMISESLNKLKRELSRLVDEQEYD